VYKRQVEPRASKPIERLDALENIASEGLSTYVFISPIFPMISDWKTIIDKSVPYNTEFHFENLNFRGHNIPRILNIITNRFPQYLEYYNEIRKDPSLWNVIEEDIEDYCKLRKLLCKIEFHHGGFSKSK